VLQQEERKTDVRRGWLAVILSVYSRPYWIYSNKI